MSRIKPPASPEPDSPADIPFYEDDRSAEVLPSSDTFVPDMMIENEDFSDYVESQIPTPVDPNQLTGEVCIAINSMLESQDIWKNGRDDSADPETLTPAQRFYLENKELLLKRASAYSIDKARTDFEKATRDIEDEWAFYRDPVVRPSRGYLWPVDAGSCGSHAENPEDDESRSESLSFEPGEFPSIENIVALLESENVTNVTPIDLELCERRDIGEWAVVGTVQSAAHGSRVGNLARRKINELGLEHIKCFMNTAIPGQEWVVTRLGHVVLHLMTQTDRDKYKLEDMYINKSEYVDEEQIERLVDPIPNGREIDLPHNYS